MDRFHLIFVFFSRNGKYFPYDERRFTLIFSDTNVPVQSNELIHLLKSVFCVVIPSYTDAEIIQIMENLPIWNNDLQLFQNKLFQLYQSLQNTKGSVHTRLVTLR